MMNNFQEHISIKRLSFHNRSQIRIFYKAPVSPIWWPLGDTGRPSRKLLFPNKIVNKTHLIRS